MKNQRFGIEIEMTGLTREAAANVIAQYFGTRARHIGGCYKEYHVTDPAGRTWKVVYDSSIRAEKKVSGGTATANDDYKVEMVSPKCNYADINDIQELARLIRKAGGIVNSSCGIHVHVDAANHNAKSLRNLVNIMASKDELIYKALEVELGRESRFCKKVNTGLVANLKRSKPETLDAFKYLWYGAFGGHDGSAQHYHSSRYHGLNLHSVFQKGTVEFRLFNSTLHAGKIKSYIQFCLAVSFQAISQKSASAIPTVTDNPAYTFRCWLLRLGMIGDEFKTARLHLMAKMEGNSAWRDASHS